jgi:hypothetical protein
MKRLRISGIEKCNGGRKKVEECYRFRSASLEEHPFQNLRIALLEAKGR